MVLGLIQRESKKSCSRVTELKLINDALHMENAAKDREIRQLNKDMQQYEQTIMNLRNELSIAQYHTPDGSKKDAEVMAGMCCTRTECGEWAPVKDSEGREAMMEDPAQYQERMRRMEANLKSSGTSVRALRRANAQLSEELHELRHVCAALGEQARAARLHAQFRDDVIREMRAQLRHAKARLKELTEMTPTKCSKDFVSGDADQGRVSSVSYDSVTIACVRQQPRRKRSVPVRDRRGSDERTSDHASGDNQD